MCACSSTWLFKDSERNDHIHVCLSIYFKGTITTILSVATLVSLTCNYQFGTHTHNANVHISSVQDGIYALGKFHMRSVPSLTSFPNVALETVPVLVWLMMALSGPFREDHLAILHSTPLSSRPSMAWCRCPQVMSQAPQHFRSSEICKCPQKCSSLDVLIDTYAYTKTAIIQS